MSYELVKVIEDHEDSIGELLEAAHKGDDEALKVGFLGLVAELVAELPLVKPLVKLGARELLSRSAAGQLRAAVAQLRAEESAEAQRKAIAAAVAELLSAALEGLKEGQEGLKRRLDALEERNRVIRIAAEHVSGGVGVDIEGKLRNDLDIRHGHISGGIGVKIR